MASETLHDKARRLGLGAMYEMHSARDEFSDLFDYTSPAWSLTSVVEKVVDLRAFASAGISLYELTTHYRAAHPAVGHDVGDDRVARTLRGYEAAGYPLHASTLGEAAAMAAERI
jgi:hypothetical protein